MVANAGGPRRTRLPHCIKSAGSLLPISLALQASKRKDFQACPDNENAAATQHHQHQYADEQSNPLSEIK